MFSDSEEYVGDFRAPTRQEIVQKMNYRMAGEGDYYRGFHDGLRETLAVALTIPSFEYATHFNEKRLFDMRWYLRMDRRANAMNKAPEVRATILAACDQIEADFPEVLNYLDVDADRRWGNLAGQHAAVRWLQEEDRNTANDFFPCTDT